MTLESLQQQVMIHSVKGRQQTSVPDLLSSAVAEHHDRGFSTVESTICRLPTRKKTAVVQVYLKTNLNHPVQQLREEWQVGKWTAVLQVIEVHFVSLQQQLL